MTHLQLRIKLGDNRDGTLCRQRSGEGLDDNGNQVSGANEKEEGGGSA